MNKVTYVTDKGREISGQVVVLADGTTVLVCPSERTYDNKRAYWAMPRVYGACDSLVPALNAAEPPYVAYTNADSTDEEIAAEKAWLSWRRRALRATTAQMAELLAALGQGQAKATFSYNAGCSWCPCSPGYIIKGSTFGNVDFWVYSLEGLTLKAKTKTAKAS